MLQCQQRTTSTVSRSILCIKVKEIFCNHWRSTHAFAIHTTQIWSEMLGYFSVSLDCLFWNIFTFLFLFLITFTAYPHMLQFSAVVHPSMVTRLSMGPKYILVYYPYTYFYYRYTVDHSCWWHIMEYSHALQYVKSCNIVLFVNVIWFISC